VRSFRDSVQRWSRTQSGTASAARRERTRGDQRRASGATLSYASATTDAGSSPTGCRGTCRAAADRPLERRCQLRATFGDRLRTPDRVQVGRERPRSYRAEPPRRERATGWRAWHELGMPHDLAVDDERTSSRTWRGYCGRPDRRGGECAYDGRDALLKGLEPALRRDLPSDVRMPDIDGLGSRACSSGLPPHLSWCS